MEKELIAQISQEDPTIRKLFEEGNFEQLLQLCSQKTDLPSMLLKAIALIELGQYEEGAQAYIAYIDGNDVFNQITEKSIATMTALFDSAFEHAFIKATTILDENLTNIDEDDSPLAIMGYLEIIKAAKAIVDKANEKNNNNAHTAVMLLAQGKIIRFVEAVLNYTQAVTDVAIAKFMKNDSPKQIGEILEYTLTQRGTLKYTERLHYLFPCCCELINLSSAYGNYQAHADMLKECTQRLVSIILSTLTTRDSQYSTTLEKNVESLLLPYGKPIRQNALEFLSDAISLAQKFDESFIAPQIPPLNNPNPAQTNKTSPQQASTAGGCYVATAVYGSYDCPQVWTLRRYRDDLLAATLLGRMFIRTYYALSPTVVKWFGHTAWFKKLWKGHLDRIVDKLQRQGFESTPYEDKTW